MEISNTTGSELHLVFALPTDPQGPYPHPLMGERWDSMIEQTKHEARQFVDGRTEHIEAEGGKIKDAHLVFGKPEDEIVKLGEELEAGLIASSPLGAEGE